MLKELPNPFRPGSGLYPPFFAGRGREIEAFNKKKESTKNNFAMHLAVLGNWAIGKTSLLKRMEKEASESFYYNYVASIESMEHFFRTFTRGLSLKVRLMRGEGLLRKIQKRIGLESLKLSFINKLVDLSGGHPYYLQEICYHVLEETQKTINEDVYELGFEKAFSDISLLVLQDKAAKISVAESKIVRSMKAKRYYSISQLSENCNIKKSSINTYLRRLKQKGILFQDNVGEYKGQYIQRDPLLKMYLDTL